MATAKKSSTSKSSPKKKAPAKKDEETNPVGRPREIVKLTANDGLSEESHMYLEKISAHLGTTPAGAVQAMLSMMVQKCRVSGPGGVAAELRRYKGL